MNETCLTCYQQRRIGEACRNCELPCKPRTRDAVESAIDNSKDPSTRWDDKPYKAVTYEMLEEPSGEYIDVVAKSAYDAVVSEKDAYYEAWKMRERDCAGLLAQLQAVTAERDELRDYKNNQRWLLDLDVAKSYRSGLENENKQLTARAEKAEAVAREYGLGITQEKIARLEALVNELTAKVNKRTQEKYKEQACVKVLEDSIFKYLESGPYGEWSLLEPDQDGYELKDALARAKEIKDAK